MLKPRLLFALGALPCLLSAQNLVPNGSFELGTAGYGIRTNLRFDTNPEQKFFPLETVADPAADGKQVLRIRNPHANRFELHSRQFPLKADTEYTFRFKIRSTAKNGQELFAVPYSVKAEAVRRTILNKVDPMVPATLLKTHPDWNLFLDRDSASQLLG